ncbi:hypothetical protein B0H17DRAFT_1191642 [Mycena rosella]|uniref:Uncharacterized protein n=1 Tax=Mycena rosella TaxID=1033263 RepID=A0AAD7GYY2_MYCRO|nr:hypothetical protein B0H17DRAFT_1191642 [Mycena rosella]
MTRKTVVLTPDERAMCRVRYRQVATYMDPGEFLHRNCPQSLTPNDRIVQAIAGHWKNGAVLEHGAEHSDLLFPFGNKRAVSRHVNKGGPKTEGADREIALAWIETQPGDCKEDILALLGLQDKRAGENDAERVKDEKPEDGDSESVKQEAAGPESVGEKGKVEDVGDLEEMLSKRPRRSTEEGTIARDIKQEATPEATPEAPIKSE